MKLLRGLLMLLFLILMGYFGFKSYQEAKLYENTTLKIAKLCDANGLASNKIDELASLISFGLLPNEHKQRVEELKKKQHLAKEREKKLFYSFLASLTLLVILSFTCTLRGSAITLAFATFISLIYGLINPILMVTIHKNIEYLGDVILSFESKGIMGSISKLLENNEVAVAITILLFSVILPLLKTLTLTFTLLFQEYKWNHKLVSFFKQIGKWSMVDVFVVATFLVYLTSNKGEVSHAEIQIGLYFFLIYVLLSMVTAILTQKVLSKKVST